MEFKCTKNICEKYTLKFNDGWDYAIFTIDENGMFNCQSTFGNYGYHWSSFGGNFKKFLCEVSEGYLFTKLCKKTYFNAQKYIEKSKKIIIKMRRDLNLTKEEAKEAWDFFDKNLEDFGDSIDLIINELASSKIMNRITGEDIWYSDFCPEKDFDPCDIAFITNVYPKFVEVLKSEINEKTA